MIVVNLILYECDDIIIRFIVSFAGIIIHICAFIVTVEVFSGWRILPIRALR